MRKTILALCSMFVLGASVQTVCAKSCCLPDGSCINTDWEDCDYRGGVYNDDLDCDHVTCAEAPCRVTGGGVDTSGNWDGSYCSGRARHNQQYDRYTFGGQAGAPTANQPQPYGEWTHHQQSGPDGSFSFHMGTSSAPEGTEIDEIECSDPGVCQPAHPGPMKQIDFRGVGIFHNIRNAPPILSGVVANVTLHWCEVHIEDLGEPGRNGHQNNPGPTCPAGGSPGGVADCACPDFYHITIHASFDPGSPVIYDVFGYIDGGNLQIHPAIDH